MGYYVQQRDSDFEIKAENCAGALAAVKALRDDYSWVNNCEVASSTTLEDAIEAWNWEAVVGDDGSIFDIRFAASKAGDEEVLFKALAPFVEDGSFIEMVGEEGEIWRWSFRGGSLHEEDGQVTFEEVANANLWANDGIQFTRMLAEIRAVGLTDGQYEGLADSMELDRAEIDALLARAEVEWEAIKERVSQG